MRFAAENPSKIIRAGRWATTNVPLPVRVTVRPSDSHDRSTSRITVRLTE